MKKFTLLSMLCFVAQLAFAQTDWQPLSLSELDQVLSEMADAYRSKNYRFETVHQSFKGHNSQQPYDEMTGFFVKSGKKYHANLLGAEVFQDARHKVVIQHQHQELQLHLADEHGIKDFTSLTSQFPELLEEVAVRMRGKSREYRMVYPTGNRISSMTFTLNSTGFLEEMVIYYAHAVAWKDESGTAYETRPKVRVAFENLKTNFEADASEFDPSPYVLIQKKGLKAGLLTAEYQLKDLRLPQK